VVRNRRLAIERRLLAVQLRVWRHLIPAALKPSLLRALYPTFLVGVLGVVHDLEGRILLVGRTYLPDGGWGFPGGFVERGESLEEAMRRELFEEAALSVTKLAPVRIEVDPLDRHKLHVLFVCSVIGHVSPRSPEVAAVRWVTPDELILMEFDDLQIFRRAGMLP
jgi:ADP-ribose pyrophosphatase YjhB (NUDIX family)